MSFLKIQDTVLTVGKVQLVVYVDDQIVASTNKKLNTSIDVTDGWHTIRFECISDLMSELEFSKINYIQFSRPLVNDQDAWPIDAGHGVKTPPVPFHMLQGHCFNGGNGYMSTDNKLYRDSYFLMYVNIENNEIVDHYYDHGDPSNIDAYPSDAWVFDDSNPGSLFKFSLVWSDVYQAYVHRLVFEDHFIVKHDPKDTSTYGAKWKGVYLEATPRALDEACNRITILKDLGDLAVGKIRALQPPQRYSENYKLIRPFTPLYGVKFLDYAQEGDESSITAESGKKVVCDYWALPHVFSAYSFESLPPEFLAFIVKIV